MLLPNHYVTDAVSQAMRCSRHAFQSRTRITEKWPANARQVIVFGEDSVILRFDRMCSSQNMNSSQVTKLCWCNSSFMTTLFHRASCNKGSHIAFPQSHFPLLLTFCVPLERLVIKGKLNVYFGNVSALRRCGWNAISSTIFGNAINLLRRDILAFEWIVASPQLICFQIQIEQLLERPQPRLEISLYANDWIGKQDILWIMDICLQTLWL